ncbi:nitroreductase family protein [Alistipes sp. kh20]|uniref:nitroreductase family protein n=1 Tax=Alistipes montrealensis TaxID=2834113 RepID=UPI001BD0AE0B|nr:nitroreductase family protein [Alistipes montrealensis]MBS4764795.1 nitroreductase family protein [Alistipes montrealensis]
MNMPKIFNMVSGIVLTILLIVSCGGSSSNAGQAVLDAISARTSIRAYQDRPVGADTVELLLCAAMSAPSARNRQPWAFIVVDDKDLLRQLADSLPYAQSAAAAPMAVVVCGVLTESQGATNAGWWVQDAAAASENLLLAAHAVGLGAVWTGVYSYEDRVRAVRNVLGLPRHVVPLNVIPIGYPAENPAPKQKWDPAKVRRNGWAE